MRYINTDMNTNATIEKPNPPRPFWTEKANVQIGIGAKLSGLIGALIAFAILSISIINTWQQSQILAEGYNREADSSRRYISFFVLELDNIAQNLIRIEDFRDRVKTQKNVLRKYRTRSWSASQNTISLLGMRTDLFGALGKKRILLTRDSYYSEYLSDQDLTGLEMRTRALLQAPGEPPLSNVEFLNLLSIAHKYVEANQIVRGIHNDLGERRQSPDHRADQNLEKLLQRKTREMRLLRTQLDNRIIAILSASQERKLKELGLDVERIRIQIFPSSSVIPGEVPRPTLDTRIFNSNAVINGDIGESNMQHDLENAFLKYAGESESPDSSLKDYFLSAINRMHATADFFQARGEPEYRTFKYRNLDLMVHYSPHYQNPSSSIRASELLHHGKKKTIQELNGYLIDDTRIAAEISGVTSRIDKRLNQLKKMNPPVPPFRDIAFHNLYTTYNALINRRSAKYNEFAKGKGESIEGAVLESVGYIRDAALEDMILVHFQNSPAFYYDYMNSDAIRNEHRQRWKAIRSWISSGRSETPPESLKHAFANGMIGFSRTEAERIMWELDSKPLLSLQNGDVVDIVNKRNFAGIVRTIVDRSTGIIAIRENRNQVMLTALLLTGFAVGLSIYVAGLVTQRIKRVIESAEDVGKGNLNVEFEQLGRDEFGNLTFALNHMVSGLREREKIKGILGCMIDPIVVGEAMKDLQALKNGSEKLITSFFSDVAGFSAISEKLTSAELAELLNEYLSTMTIVLKEHNGVLDKYIGDAIVGIFNAPVEVENHTARAVRASFRMIDRMQELRQKWNYENKYSPEAREMQFRIGLNRGLAKVGFMGTDALASYTMMGDTVNLAARLEAAAKDYGVTVLGTHSVYAEVKDSVWTRKLDLVRVKGRSEPVVIYELLGDSESEWMSQAIKESAAIYEHGLELYLQRDWKRAIEAFQESERKKGESDKAVHMLIKRIEHYQQSPPPEDWDGVFTRDHK